MEDTPFRPIRQPIRPEDLVAAETKPEIKGPIPPALQEVLRKSKESEGAPEPKTSSKGVPTSNNGKLEELLAGIRPTTATYEEALLPSRGKFYEADVAPTNGVVHLRCMTGQEEQILATQRYLKKGLAMNMIFKNCIQEPIRPELLLTQDRQWLLIFLRGISYGHQYEVRVKCSECNSRFATVIDLDQLPVTYCPDNFGPAQLQGKLPASGYRFTYHLGRGLDEQVIQNHQEQRLRQHGDQGTDDTWNFRAATLLEDIEGLNEVEALQTLLTRLPIQDVACLRTVLNEPPFGVNTKVQVLCPVCAEEFEVFLPMDAGFFWPTVKTDEIPA